MHDRLYDVYKVTIPLMLANIVPLATFEQFKDNFTAKKQSSTNVTNDDIENEMSEIIDIARRSE